VDVLRVAVNDRLVERAMARNETASRRLLPAKPKIKKRHAHAGYGQYSDSGSEEDSDSDDESASSQANGSLKDDGRSETASSSSSSSSSGSYASAFAPEKHSFRIALDRKVMDPSLLTHAGRLNLRARRLRERFDQPNVDQLHSVLGTSALVAAAQFEDVPELPGEDKLVGPGATHLQRTNLLGEDDFGDFSALEGDGDEGNGDAAVRDAFGADIAADGRGGVGSRRASLKSAESAAGGVSRGVGGSSTRSFGVGGFDGGAAPSEPDGSEASSTDVSVGAPVSVGGAHRGVRRGGRSVAAALLALGSEVNVVADDGFAALHAAAGQGNLHTVQRLIRAGAHRGVRDRCEHAHPTRGGEGTFFSFLVLTVVLLCPVRANARATRGGHVVVALPVDVLPLSVLLACVACARLERSLLLPLLLPCSCALLVGMAGARTRWSSRSCLWRSTRPPCSSYETARPCRRPPAASTPPAVPQLSTGTSSKPSPGSKITLAPLGKHRDPRLRSRLSL